MTAISLLRPELIVPGVLVLALALAVGVWNWRWSIYGLLCYLPFSGIPILAAYPGRTERAVAILAKDFVFVIPAYVGFLAFFALRRRRFWFPGAPLVLFGLLALVVLIQAFNPELPNHLIGFVGIKIWLFYIPLVFLGYHLVQSRPDLFRVLGLMSLVAIVPIMVGLVEVVLYYAGEAGTVYSAYGDAAAPATQNFTTFVLPGGCEIRRVPSTFSFFYQYYLFAASMIVIVYGWWRGSRPAGRQLWGGGVLFGLVCLAALFSGLRLAFVVIPLLVIVMLILARKSANTLPWAAVAAGACVLLVGGGVGAGTCGIAQHLTATTTEETHHVITTGVSEAVHRTWLGLGAGADSTGARYAFPNVEQASLPVGSVQESWYVKTYLELGVFGLVIVAALLGTILFRIFRLHQRIRDPRLKVVSAGIVALIGWVLLYNVKAQYLDLDPINIYFWLFIGMLMKFPLLEREPTEASPQPEPVLVEA